MGCLILDDLLAPQTLGIYRSYHLLSAKRFRGQEKLVQSILREMKRARQMGLKAGPPDF